MPPAGDEHAKLKTIYIYLQIYPPPSQLIVAISSAYQPLWTWAGCKGLPHAAFTCPPLCGVPHAGDTQIKTPPISTDAINASGEGACRAHNLKPQVLPLMPTARSLHYQGLILGQMEMA